MMITIFKLNPYITILVCSLLLQSCGNNSGSNTSSPTNPINNLPTTPPKAILSVDCSGSSCGAISPVNYSGKGIGLWQYTNTSTQDAIIDLDILGVSSNNQVTLVFTNGERKISLNTPSLGTALSAEKKSNQPFNTNRKTFQLNNQVPIFTELHSNQTVSNHNDHAHRIIIDRNQALKQALIKNTNNQSLNFNNQLNKKILTETVNTTPAVNSQRTWIDSYPNIPTNHVATNKHVCPLPSGRNLVFWQDTTDTKLNSVNLQNFINHSCGPSGTFARLNTLLGDFWGTTNNRYANVISDTVNFKQDINIVFLNPIVPADWAGYFYSGNNFTSTPYSNKALVFFVNTESIAEDPNFYMSTLIHEATHMIAFYQNVVVRDKQWDESWLDELLAMMSEDIIVPAVTNYNKILDLRLPRYLQSGANISLNNWQNANNVLENYHMGGSFGAFLNRRYGLKVYQQLISACTNTTLINDEYGCLDYIIIQNGGKGIADELAKMGASIFSRSSLSTGLTGYGFPKTYTDNYVLQGIDLSKEYLAKPNIAFSYPSMSHVYLNDTIPNGSTRYIRQSVRIPAMTRLHVVIK